MMTAAEERDLCADLIDYVERVCTLAPAGAEEAARMMPIWRTLDDARRETLIYGIVFGSELAVDRLTDKLNFSGLNF